MVNAQYRYIYGFYFNDRFVPLFYDLAYLDLIRNDSNLPFLKYSYKLDKKIFSLPDSLTNKCIRCELIDKSIYFAQVKYKRNKKGARKILSGSYGLNSQDLYVKPNIDTVGKKVLGTYAYESGNYEIIDCILTKVPSKEIFLKRLETGTVS